MRSPGRYLTLLANGLLVHKVLKVLAGAGIVVEPYSFYREPASPTPPPTKSADGSEFEFFEAGPGDAGGIASLDGKRDNRDEILRSFRNGKRCFAVSHGGRIVAVSWCDVREIDYEPCRRPLSGDEAYLYGMETLFSHRGHSLAPYLRSLCHHALLAEGRKVVYSYTDRFNRPAVRFKAKIGARRLFTGLYVKVFGRTLVNRGPGGWKRGEGAGAGGL